MSDANGELATLLAKQEITEVLHRYSRAVDRRDWEGLEAIYWDDAVDHHGISDGPATGLIDWLKENLGPGLTYEWMFHAITNILIEVTGDTAAVESYFTASQQCNRPDGPTHDVAAGRYVDRFERRGGEWRVLERTVVYEWATSQASTPPVWAELEGNFHTAKDYPHDHIYGLLGVTA